MTKIDTQWLKNKKWIKKGKRYFEPIDEAPKEIWESYERWKKQLKKLKKRNRFCILQILP